VTRNLTSNRYLIPVALLGLALVVMTIGMACHHHAGISDDSTCSICHLGHQPMDRPMGISHAPTFVALAPAAEPREIQLAPNPVFRRVPARAPPMA